MKRKTEYPTPVLFLGYILVGIAFLMATIMFTSCSSHRGATTAKGIVVFPDTVMAVPYYALVPNLDKKDPAKWMRWEAWEMQDMYSITAAPGETIHCIWLKAAEEVADQDTLAQLTFKGIYGKQKVYNDTLVLDGSHYYRGRTHKVEK